MTATDETVSDDANSSTPPESEQDDSENEEQTEKGLPPGWDDVPALATVEEMAELLRTTKKTVYNLLEDNDVPGARKVGRSWRVSVESFQEWYESGSE